MQRKKSGSSIEKIGIVNIHKVGKLEFAYCSVRVHLIAIAGGEGGKTRREGVGAGFNIFVLGKRLTVLYAFIFS